MKKSIGVKKAFTLIELIIVLILISITYFLVFSSNNFSIKEQKQNLNLENLKEFLFKNFKFENELKFFCIDDDLSCYVKIDNSVNENFKVEHFFKEAPVVYEYYKDETRLEYSKEKVTDHTYNVVFEFTINRDYKTNEFILDTLEDRIFVFNSIYEKPFIYENLNEAFETFRTNEIEVRDAF